MPLSPEDRRFLRTVDRLKLYLLLLASSVFIYLLCSPAPDRQALLTSILGVALCGVFWLTQRLLGFISHLDMELSRLLEVVKRTLPPEQREGLSV
jgi:hypothetical protein